MTFIFSHLRRTKTFRCEEVPETHLFQAVGSFVSKTVRGTVLA